MVTKLILPELKGKAAGVVAFEREVTVEGDLQAVMETTLTVRCFFTFHILIS